MNIKLISSIIALLGTVIGGAVLLIKNSYANFGYSILIIILLIIFYLVVKLTKKEESPVNNCKNDEEKEEEKTEEIVSLRKSHHVFSDIKDFRMKIRVVDFDTSKIKEAAIKDYLIIKYKAIEEELLIPLANKVDTVCNGGCNFIQDLIEHTIEVINERARKIGLPEMFITKFMEFHQPHIDIYWNITQKTCQTRLLINCSEKIVTHFFNNLFILDLTLEDAKTMLGSVNGDLEDKLNELEYLEKRKKYITEYNLVRYD